MKIIHIVYVTSGRFVLPYANALQRLGFADHYIIPIGRRSRIDEFCKSTCNAIPLDYPQKNDPLQFLRFFKRFVRVLKTADRAMFLTKNI